MKKIQIKDIMFFVIIIALVIITSVSSIKKNGQDDKLIAVHVKGEVKSPGYYELPYGKRVNDAVHKAGGFTKNADENAVNLAMILRDGEEVVIPAEKEK
jgi:competence protein ComEA